MMARIGLHNLIAGNIKANKFLRNSFPEMNNAQMKILAGGTSISI
jgi:hypothetical protein